MDAHVPRFEGRELAAWYRAMSWWRWAAWVQFMGFPALGFFAAFGSPECSPADPSICGPRADVMGMFAAAMVYVAFLSWRPLVSCAGGIVLGGLTLWSPLVPFPWRGIALAIGAVSLANAVALTLARRRQAEIARRAGAGATATLPRPQPRARPARRLGAPVAVLLLTLLAGALAWTFQATQGEADRQAAAAERTIGTVEGRVDWGVLVFVPELEDVVEVGSTWPALYEDGEQVLILLDRSGGEPWVGLVAEPPDQTLWLSAAVLALVLAGVVGAGDLRARVVRRRLLSTPAPAVRMQAEPWGPKLLVLPGSPAFDAWPARVGVALDRRQDRPDVGAEPEDDLSEAWLDHLEELTEPGRSASEEPLPWVTVVGDLRDGGWVGTYDDAFVQLPRRPVRARPPMGRRRR